MKAVKSWLVTAASSCFGAVSCCQWLPVSELRVLTKFPDSLSADPATALSRVDEWLDEIKAQIGANFPSYKHGHIYTCEQIKLAIVEQGRWFAAAFPSDLRGSLGRVLAGGG